MLHRKEFICKLLRLFFFLFILLGGEGDGGECCGRIQKNVSLNSPFSAGDESFSLQ